jgi:preprotein translocase SecE subunit
MAHITRIKAGEHKTKVEEPEEAKVVAKAKVVDKKTTKANKKAARKKAKAEKKAAKKAARAGKKTFILFRPFVAIAHYIRDSWRELRQVRWPNRKATWKMVFAVIVYTALFVVLITLLDLFFRWLFNLIIK